MRLVVGPITAVERLVADAAIDHVVTLVSPDAEISAIAVPRTVLRFNDINEPRPGLVAPNAATIESLFGLRGKLAADATLLIHCHAGVSRSTAAAYILTCAHRPPGEEAAWALRLRDASPEATPNALMIALADRALGRGGAMVRAIARIGRGVDCHEGSIFDWTLDWSPFCPV